jgi:outer membrane protein assembly factor BamB
MKDILRITSSALAGALVCIAADAAPVHGWLNWRGPDQNGSSRETGLPDKIAAKDALWTADFPGASTPVIANGKLYIMGYLGEGPDLQEGIACFDAETGKKIWQQLYNDFLSDIIYNRYARASAAIDPETGDVFMQGTQGILAAFTPDGKELWKHSLMEEFGRLTFPNGRTASPVVDRDLVIVRGITANWGSQGPAADRFYAFDKKTGEIVWASNPGGRPKDNSYSQPYLGWRDGKRVLYATLGDGSVACINARTGEPLWRVPLFKAGINASVLVHDDKTVIAIYGVPYEPGELIAFKIPDVTPANSGAGPVVVDRKKVQLWQADISTSTSSPILAGDMVYVVAEKGDFCAVDADTGEIKWKLKLGIEERNSSPLFADGKLYVPMLDDPDTKTEGGEAGTTGALYVIKPGDKPEILSHAALDGRCFGTPVAYNGKIYLQTARKLYCWGKPGNNSGLPPEPAPEKWPAAGPAKSLQIIPAEITLRPGRSASFRARSIDANGFVVDEIKDVASLKWASFVPPTAKVRSTLKGKFDAEGRFIAGDAAEPSAGAFAATLGNLKGYIRGRVLPYLPLHENFESFKLTEKNASDGSLFAYPPLPWIGARFKFEVQEKDGSKVLAKTVSNPFFARAFVFFGAPEAKNYTIEADVMSDGNRRKMSEVGVINQRYLTVLKGNEQKLEINSNLDRIRVDKNFRWSAKTWYHLKTRVDMAADGSGVVRAKAWKRGDPEPAAWTLEVPHKIAHQNGSPGLYGFSPQGERVYIDNITVTAN